MYTASISLESQEERELLFAVKVPHILQCNIERRHRKWEMECNKSCCKCHCPPLIPVNDTEGQLKYPVSVPDYKDKPGSPYSLVNMMDSYHTGRNCHSTGYNHANANRRVDSLIRTIRTLEISLSPEVFR